MGDVVVIHPFNGAEFNCAILSASTSSPGYPSPKGHKEIAELLKNKI